jgi:PPOX class probable F420-dependent enzyme
VRLDEDECWRRLDEADHAVLATVHAERGVDAVPVVFAVLDDGRLVVPIDAVKPKAGGRLQRLANLEHDPRCVLLAEHYADDWTQLWWVRVHATAEEVEPSASLVEALVARYEQYHEPGSVPAAIVLTPTQITGWSAT